MPSHRRRSIVCSLAGQSIPAGFILAALKAEGLVIHMEDMRRYYQCTNADQFFVEMKILADAINAGELGMAIESDEVSTAKPMQIAKSKKR